MRVILGLLIAVFAGFSAQSPPVETDEMLAQLSKIRLDKKQLYKIRDITIRRDVLSIALKRGTFEFLEPVMGRVTGAVFIGSGEVVALTSDEIERRQLFRFTRLPALSEPFTVAYLRFTDNTYDEILREYADRAQEDVTDDEAEQFLPWAEVLTDRSGLLNYRIMTDFLSERPQPIFMADLTGDRMGTFTVVYDERLPEEVVALKTHERPEGAITDIWASFNKRSESRNPESMAHENKVAIDIVSYDIDATITPERTLSATSKFRARARLNGDRVIGFSLSRSLRVASVTSEDGTPLSFYQNTGMTEEQIRTDGLDSVTVVLPEALREGQDLSLNFTYAGNVLERNGNGIFYLRDNEPWYPNPGQQDRALFKLTFHYPAQFSLVASGRLIREWEDGGARHSSWDSEIDFGGAGFHFGEFTIASDETAPVPIDVSGAGGLGETVLQDVRSTIEYFTRSFGALPYKRLTVSQSPMNHSQGWPTLLYLSTASLADNRAMELVRAHAVAHQWFGNLVGGRSYHDQWLTEGLSNYAAAMYLERKYNDEARLREILDNARTRLLALNAAGNTVDSAGPAWLGYRLESSDNPNGYYDGVYNKGAWITHMVRMLMRDSASGNSDERFLAMMRDFIGQYSGRVASTWDFKKVVESHMTPEMDLQNSGKMDWFFDQWVFGTGIPSYELDFSLEPSAAGFVLEGTVTQAGVPNSFVMPLPVYADDEMLGRVIISDGTGAFRFTLERRPTAVTLDPQRTILWNQ